MAIVWGVLVTVWLVRWFVYFARFSMASFFSTHGVEVPGIFFFGSLLLAWLDLPAHSALDSGGFLGKAYGASLVEIFFREGHGYRSKMYAYSEHIGALHWIQIRNSESSDRFSNIPIGYDRLGNAYSKDIDGGCTI
ncbi:uncharacterized protein K441DRAFT_151527 [Cenococcum geophilum 1.58]|uniref:uncharacterized protein n=1 Tax=Cenococcum geophilum 1.58 TaxID=794803 RepID=UPI00358E2CFD|nr:hypothetical protein K441DRAFT_151527 [Cenococcum geophilum 1.58]